MSTNKNYTPLHVHSDASLLDGLSKPKKIVERTIDIQADGCALTDHGSISNCVSFLQAMKKGGKKPVLGSELYISELDAKIKDNNNRSLAHLPVLAKNTKGWNNLVKLTSEANHKDHYYHRPRLSLEQLSEYLDGNIIGFSGHLGSHISNAIEEYGLDGGIRTALILEKLFGKGNFWLECQLMDRIVTPKQIEITKIVREISKKTGIPCIATPDAHYAYKQDAILQRILLCSNMSVTLEKGRLPNFGMRTFFLSDNFHIPSYQEMIDYGHTEEELENTNIILSQIEDYDILKAPMLKVFDCPDGMNPDEYLRHLCRQGWKKLIADKIPKSEHPKYVERIKNELEVLEGAGLSSYFLIVQDILNFVNQQGWLPGPGRGSAAGCLVSYLIGITKIDPMKYDLIFERFYNAGRNTEDRISMPDIDVDIPIKHRTEVIEYIKSKYGNECVSQIVTYQTMKGARALKEVFRAYGDLSFEEINMMTRNIVEESKIADQLQEMDNPSIIRWCLENRAKEFKEWCEIDDNGNLTGKYADRFDQAIKLEGTKSAQAKHAAGIIVAPRPLSELCPMIYDSKTKGQIAGMEMNDLESIGLIKLDILGVAMLDKVMCIKDMLDRDGVNFNPDIDEIGLDCPKTWKILSEGNTKGVFQLENRLGQSVSKNLKPEHMEHLSALTAIIRPGCLEVKKADGKNVTSHYIDNKNGNKDPEYLDDSLRPILSSTYSEMIYQEQALRIAKDIAGFDLKQADILRKAIGKKDPKIMANLKKEFLKGCEDKNIVNSNVAEQLFEQIEKSQRYSFNKAHSVSYGYNAYLSAYCKAHYPKYFFTAYLRFAKEKIKPQLEIYELVNNAKAMDIWVMPPNIKMLNPEFDLIKGKIYFGLCDIKNVGNSVLEKLICTIEQSEKILNKKFADWNWLEFLFFAVPHIKVNSLESLVNVGACDCFGKSRTEMELESKAIKEFSNKEMEWIQNNFDSKSTLKDTLKKIVNMPSGRSMPCSNKNRIEKLTGVLTALQVPATSLVDKPHQIAQLEYELLGVNITSYSTDECVTKYKANCSCSEYNRGFGKNGQPVIIASKIDSIRVIKTKNGNNPGQEMAFIEASDETGIVNNGVIFPDYWAEYKNMVVEGNCLLLCGKRSEDRSRDSFIIELIEQM